MNGESKVDMNLDNAIFGGVLPERQDKIEIPQPTPVKIASSLTGNADSDKDYREVRDNLKRVIVQSEDAIQGVLQVAQEKLLKLDL